MKIITIPHPTLRQTAQPITEVTPALKRLVSHLQKTLKNAKNPQGVGLAANQVDRLDRVFATQFPTITNKPQLRYFINPEIIDHSKRLVLGVDPQDPDFEGCLSIPFIYGPVPRYSWVELTYQQLDHNQLVTHTEKFIDFAARVVQHERDHLDGILFTDYSIKHDLPVFRLENEKWIEIDKSLIEVI